MSDFSILAVKDGAWEDPLYPMPGEQPDTVELAPADGQTVERLTATEMTVLELTSGSARRLLHVEKMKAVVFITDARVAVACSKFDKGGGWTPWSISAIPVAIAANTASKIKASRRRRGKMLVGHMPYAQLRAVGFRKTGMVRAREQLRVAVNDPTVEGVRGLALDLTLSGRQSASAISRAVISRAARHRLDESQDLDEAARKHLEGLLEPGPLPPASGKNFAMYQLHPQSTEQA